MAEVKRGELCSLCIRNCEEEISVNNNLYSSVFWCLSMHPKGIFFPQQNISECGVNHCCEIRVAVRRSKLSFIRGWGMLLHTCQNCLLYIYWKQLPFCTALHFIWRTPHVHFGGLFFALHSSWLHLFTAHSECKGKNLPTI